MGHDTINKTIVNTELPVVEAPEISGTLGNIVKIYNNAETDKLQILSDNKGKAGIYQWTHIESNKSYIGSAVDLSKRLKNYYSKSYISDKNKGNSYIYNAIISHGYSAFSLTIIEYIDISGSNTSKDEAKTLILEKEQYYIDSLSPEYNILKIAGSSLGFKHSEESLALMSFAKSGENHPLYGKAHSAETLAKISLANSGENHPMYGRTGENHPFYGPIKLILKKQKLN